VKLIHNSQTKNGLDGNCAVEDQPFGTVASCGMDLSKVLDFEPDYDSAMEPHNQPSVEFGEPLQDWFEMALKAETPVRAPAKNSWGEDEEEGEDELPIGDTEDEEQDPFEDFDEDDFDDDFDDDFEEELDDEYEIEPADDGLVPGAVEDIDEEILDEEEEIEPGISDVD
jgi:hypothetical protein